MALLRVRHQACLKCHIIGLTAMALNCTDPDCIELMHLTLIEERRLHFMGRDQRLAPSCTVIAHVGLTIHPLLSDPGFSIHCRDS